MLLTNTFTRDARVEREARTLAEAGHEVRVFCLAGEGLPTEEERDGYSLRRVEAPAWIGWTGPRRVVPLLRWYSRYGFLALAAEEWKPEVVHGHDIETLLPAGALAARLGVPHVHDDHELGLAKLAHQTPAWLRGPKRWAMEVINTRLLLRGEALHRRWLPRCAAVVTVSDGCADDLRRFGSEPVVVRNLPSLSDLPPDPRLRERAGLPPGKRIALSQGTMTEATAPDACVSAARHLPGEWAVVFLGVTWMRGRLEDQARREGVADRVRFLDAVPPGELLGYTRAADVGLTPVRVLNASERLGLSNKLFEYMHAGIPIVTTEGTAQAEVVRAVDGGLVVEGLDPKDLAEAILRLDARGEAEKAAMRERLVRAAREEYCWEVESRKLRDLYARITAGL